ncbi:aspartyl protease family protein 1-like [Wolffia australiana]
MAASAFIRFLLAVGALIQKSSSAATFGFEFHHRFSDRVRQWAESENWVDRHGNPWHWPEKGSVDYYAALLDHDRVFRGRMLAGSEPPVTFLSGNDTVRVPGLGYLHYAEVSVGTPGKKFFVALDTGSDLFWLPCDCTSCAPISSPKYGLSPNVTFNIYDPKLSLTSKSVPCGSSYCELSSQCSSIESQCPYNVKYVSENTSTTGVLVQDILRLRTDDSGCSTVDAKIIVGCGRTQTGHFLDRAAPNGLFGLGLNPVSVPSILSKSGITAKSFSMCFSPDGVGRIRFGDQGSSDQAETPLVIDPRHPTYQVKITGLRVGGNVFTGIAGAIMDSGTSFTYLADPLYSVIANTFDSSVQDQRISADSRIPFEYCYVLRGNQSTVPTLGLTLEGGQEFPIFHPILLVHLEPGGDLIYCLAIMKSDNINIIGQNFMTGLRIVFNGEKLVLGWKEANCYRENGNSSCEAAPPASPTVGVGPSSFDFDRPVREGPTSSPSNGNKARAPTSIGHSLSLSFLQGVLPLLLSLLFFVSIH